MRESSLFTSGGGGLFEGGKLKIFHVAGGGGSLKISNFRVAGGHLRFSTSQDVNK